MKMLNLICTLTLTTILIGCSNGKQAVCPMSEYVQYHYDSSQNSQCGEVYGDEDHLYGFGEGQMRGGNEDMIERMAQANAIMDLGQKAAGITNRIKGSIIEVIEQNEDGTTVTKSGIETNFEIQLQGVESVGSLCEDSDSGTVCYKLMKMPKEKLLGIAENNLKEMDEKIYEKWVASSSYENLKNEL